MGRCGACWWWCLLLLVLIAEKSTCCSSSPLLLQAVPHAQPCLRSRLSPALRHQVGCAAGRRPHHVPLAPCPASPPPGTALLCTALTFIMHCAALRPAVLCCAVPAVLQRRPGLHLLCPQPQRRPGSHPGYLPGLVPRHARLGGAGRPLWCRQQGEWWQRLADGGCHCCWVPQHDCTTRQPRPPSAALPAPACSWRWRRARRAALPPPPSWLLHCRAISSSCTAAMAAASSTSLVRTAHCLSSLLWGLQQPSAALLFSRHPTHQSFQSASLRLCCSRQAAQPGALLGGAADGVQQRAPAGAAAL